MPLLMGACAGAIHDVKPAKEIIDEMICVAVAQLQDAAACIVKSKL